MCGLRCGALRAEGQFHATEVDALSCLFLATDNEHWHMFSPRQAVSRLHRLRADERQCPSIDVCHQFSIGHLPAAPVSRSRRRGAIRRPALDQCGRDTSSRNPCGVLRCLLLAAALVPSSGKVNGSRTRRRARWRPLSLARRPRSGPFWELLWIVSGLVPYFKLPQFTCQLPASGCGQAPARPHRIVTHLWH